MALPFIVSFGLATLALPFSNGHPSCLDRSGLPVDWWVMWKTPSCVIPPPSHTSKEPAFICKEGSAQVRNYTIGYHFLYADARSPELVLVHNSSLRCTKTECDTSSPFTATTSQLYEGDGVSSLAYNDQPQNKASVNGDIFAHAKGMLAFDDDEGFWMVHSAPNTPTPDYASLFDPSPYAQHFFCLTLPTDTIGLQTIPLLRMNNVFVDNSTATSVLKSHKQRFPEIEGLLSQTLNHERTPITPPYDGPFHVEKFSTSAGLEVVAVAKKGMQLQNCEELVMQLLLRHSKPLR